MLFDCFWNQTRCEFENKIMFCKMEYTLLSFIGLIIFLLCWDQESSAHLERNIIKNA